MKHKKSIIIMAAIAALAGCASPSHNSVTTEPVGPDLAQPRINISAGKGNLLVYTARNITVGDPVAYFPTHSSYRIFNEDGSLLKTVDNRTGTFDQEPLTVTLPVGKYKVEGRATNYGKVLVPVVVMENKTTLVDLEGTALPQHKATGAGQWIRLPDGQVVGMRVE